MIKEGLKGDCRKGPACCGRVGKGPGSFQGRLLKGVPQGPRLTSRLQAFLFKAIELSDPTWTRPYNDF